MTSTAPAQKYLFVFDFDDTLVHGNTDLQPIDKLAPDLHDTHLNNPTLRQRGWTFLINEVLGALHARNITPHEILKSAAETPMPAPIKQTLVTLSENPQVESCIASDANSLYIDACLRANNLSTRNFTAGIFTNPAYVNNDRVFLRPYESEPHSCTQCPTNLCKGKVLAGLMSKYLDYRLVYVGDGGNDYCPAKRVPATGYVLPRKGFRLERRINERGQVHAVVRSWGTPEELQSIVYDILSFS